MEVRKIIEKYLKENDCNGLSHDGVCCCTIEDIAPCECCNLNICRAVKFRETIGTIHD